MTVIEAFKKFVTTIGTGLLRYARNDDEVSSLVLRSTEGIASEAKQSSNLYKFVVIEKGGGKIMWEEILQAVVSSGVWAVLFCALLIYQLKDGRKREEQYQETIGRLSKGLEELTRAWDGIKRGIEEINRDIEMLKMDNEKRNKEK